MRKILAILGCLLISAPCFGDDPVSVGEAAPEFKLPGSDGKDYKLSDFKDKQFVVIAWYPKAFTGG